MLVARKLEGRGGRETREDVDGKVEGKERVVGASRWRRQLIEPSLSARPSGEPRLFFLPPRSGTSTVRGAVSRNFFAAAQQKMPLHFTMYCTKQA